MEFNHLLWRGYAYDFGEQSHVSVRLLLTHAAGKLQSFIFFACGYQVA